MVLNFLILFDFIVIEKLKKMFFEIPIILQTLALEN